MIQNRVPYAEARGQIKNGYLLQFRARDWYTPIIGLAGGTEYVHSAMAGMAWGRVLCIQMTSGVGRGAVPLSVLVEQHPGCIDVYAPRVRNFHSRQAVATMIDITGRDYGWRNLVSATLTHVPFTRWLVRPNRDDLSQSPWPPYCSSAVSYACRVGGGATV